MEVIMQSFKFLFFIMLFVGGNTYAQLPHSFTKVAHDTSNGGMYRIAISLDGTVFTTSDSGLCAYVYDGSSFSLQAISDSVIFGTTIAVNSDEVVFVAWDSILYAYSYNGSSFSNTAQVNTCSNIRYLAIDFDGNIFITNSSGLYAYTYSGSAFTKRAYIDSIDVGGFTVSLDSTLFLLEDGLSAYYYNGSSFTKTAHINDIQMPGIVNLYTNVTFSLDGTIFIIYTVFYPYSWASYLYSYNYDGSSFTKIDSINAYSYNHIALGPNETVFMSYSFGEFTDQSRYLLGTYNYSGSSITNFAQVVDSVNYHSCTGLAVDSNGTIFLIGWHGQSKGLVAYTYSGYTAIENVLPKTPDIYELLQNYPNPFNPATTISYQLPEVSEIEISIYNLLGQKITTLVSQKQSAGNYKVEWDASRFASGIYFYRLETDKGFVQSKKLILLK